MVVEYTQTLLGQEDRLSITTNQRSKSCLPLTSFTAAMEKETEVSTYLCLDDQTDGHDQSMTFVHHNKCTVTFVRLIFSCGFKLVAGRRVETGTLSEARLTDSLPTPYQNVNFTRRRERENKFNVL